MSVPTDQVLPLIRKYESSGNYTATNPESSAQGAYQIIKGTWQQYAPQAGVDISQYPTANTAPPGVQDAVATQIYNSQGIQPWRANTRLITAYNASGGNFVGQSASDAPLDENGIPIPPVNINPDGTIQPGSTSYAPGSAGSSAYGGSAYSSAASAVTGLLPNVWGMISRGLLIFLGIALVIMALAAMLFQSKTVQTTAKAIAT